MTSARAGKYLNILYARIFRLSVYLTVWRFNVIISCRSTERSEDLCVLFLYSIIRPVPCQRARRFMSLTYPAPPFAFMAFHSR